jgi:hypothetical protein
VLAGAVAFLVASIAAAPRDGMNVAALVAASYPIHRFVARANP